MMFSDAVRLHIRRSESQCKQWAVTKDANKGSCHGEAKMKM